MYNKNISTECLKKIVEEKNKQISFLPIGARVKTATDFFLMNWRVREYYKRTWILSTLRECFRIIFKRI